MPVWRLQTVEEQRELLALDQQVTTPDIKHEVEEILGGDVTTTSADKLEPVSVVQYCSFGFPNPLAGRQGRDGSTITNQLIFNARSEGITEKKMWGQSKTGRMLALGSPCFRVVTDAQFVRFPRSQRHSFTRSAAWCSSTASSSSTRSWTRRPETSRGSSLIFST
jgi:hypothetical protein